MAKMIYEVLEDNSYANIRPFFDSIAEECDLIEISNENDTLIVTVDTVVFKISPPSTGSATQYVAVNTTFGSITMCNNTKLSTGSNPTYMVFFADNFFVFDLVAVTSGSKNHAFVVVYEKIEGRVFTQSSTGGPNIYNMYSDGLSTNSAMRYPSFNYTSSIANQIDYSAATTFSNSTNSNYVKLGGTDTNFVACSKISSYLDIVTFNNRDYFAITNYILIPLDPEEEE